MHSTEFIAEMKSALQSEEQEISHELKGVAHNEKGDYQANFPDYGRNDEENAAEVADFGATAATTQALESRLKEVRAALKRMEEGSYGFNDAGELIPENRLRANPAATNVVEK